MKIEYCPFCGSSAELVRKNIRVADDGIIKNEYFVRCKVCKATTRDCASFIFQNEKGEIKVESDGAMRAIECWNSRPVEVKKNDQNVL